MTRPRSSLRALAGAAAAGLVVAALAWGLLSLLWPHTPVHIRVRWAPALADGLRAELERRFQLTGGRPTDGDTWEYQLSDPSTATIRHIVESDQVDDTAHLNRIRYRPEFAQDRSRQIVASAAAAGAAGAVAWLLFGGWIRRAVAAAPAPPVERAVAAPPPPAPFTARATIVTIVGGAVVALGLALFAHASFVSTAAALLIVYGAGYVAGALLIPRVDGLPWGVIRMIAGLLLTTAGFLFSLVLSVPWFVGPAALVGAAIVARRRDAFRPPRLVIAAGWDSVASVVLATLLLSPVLMSFVYMTPGIFPPVFYNIDTAFALEKVHALLAATTYPPPSLSNVGIERTYHYGSQAMAALIARGSGLLPHHALFMIVLPLLTTGVIAAAVAVAQRSAPLPRIVVVPLLLVSVPTIVEPFTAAFGRGLWHAATGTLVPGEFIRDYDLWGILSNEGPNIGGDFVILATIAGIASARTIGWTLPAFLIGVALLVKTPAGIALMAGFALAEAWRMARERRLRPSPQILMAAAAFGGIALLFFVVRFDNHFRVQLYPLFHLRELIGRGHVRVVLVDMLWLLLPALLVASARVAGPEKRSGVFLLMALAPILVVNVTRLDNVGPGGTGTGDDWFQMLHSVPFLLHAYAVSLAAARWHQLAAWRRAAVLAVMVLATAPVIAAASSYTLTVARDPASGTDFVDNRELAAALAAVPTGGTMIVTNDLRYPAGNFTRDYRQMQIPALFGHQAFAVNYAHEAVEDRRPLQQLLQQETWTGEIARAARTHGWTHLLVRKDYPHPEPNPLEQIFDSERYAVFRFR